MSRRIHVMHGVFSPETERLLRQMDVQLLMVGVIAVVLAFGMTFGATTPLRALADRLDAVTSGDLRAPLDPRARYASTMLNSIDRLNTLVENLLLLSSDVTHTGEAVTVGELVREVTTFVSLGLGGRPVEIAIGEAGVTPAARVLGSRNRLIQALSNIVLNAVQSTPDGGRMTVGVTPGDAHVAIRVHNTGSYIPPDVMKRLFVPFFTTKPSGTGLGLAIARQIVTAHHGQLSVESDRASGTCFIIELPAAGTASATPADASLTARA